MDLDQISKISDQKEKSRAYTELIDNSKNDANLMKRILESALDDTLPLVVARNTVNYFAEVIANKSDQDEEWKKDIIKFSLEKLKARLVSFEEPDETLREILAGIYAEDEEYILAAKTLSAINLESGSRQYSNEQKAAKYVKIAELFLQEDDTVNAENFVNRASRFIHGVSDWALKLRYQVSYARILDAKRKFLDAALRYYEFSHSNPDEVDPDDLFELLGKAVTCAILASAGPQRSRVLAKLYKDERVKNTEHAGILEKMYIGRLLQPREVAQFAESLLPHQKAVLSNGFTVLEQAVLEHNMLAASRIYDNIRISDLGLLLEIDSSKAEKVAARMITEERMKGSIDQTEGILFFEGDEDTLQSWDDRINDICFNVNNCAEYIQSNYASGVIQEMSVS